MNLKNNVAMALVVAAVIALSASIAGAANGPYPPTTQPTDSQKSLDTLKSTPPAM
jgi:hypothetical protein